MCQARSVYYPYVTIIYTFLDHFINLIISTPASGKHLTSILQLKQLNLEEIIQFAQRQSHKAAPKSD